VEQGTHSELMAANGYYKLLWQKQAGFHFSADGRHVDIEGARLRQFPMFEKLSESILEELALCFATETFPADRDIVRQNDPGDKFYVIVRGTAETSDVAVLQDGDSFGEITLITAFPRTATVRTKTICTCISLERVHFERALGRNREPGKAAATTAG
jgi:ATP-binding cassette subfamily B protein